MATIKIGSFTAPKPKVEEDNVIEEVKLPKVDSVLQGTETSDRFIHYINGYRWKTTYFNRISTSTAPDERFDINANPSEVSMTKIYNMDIILDSALEGPINELTGQGIISTELTPSTGDAFIGMLGDGTNVIFTVDSVERLSYRNDNAYKIGFSYYIKADVEKIELMNQFVKEELYNVTVIDGNKLVTEKDKSDIEVLVDAERVLNDFYKHTLFVNGNTLNFKLPNGRKVLCPEFNYIVYRIMKREALQGILDNQVRVEPIFDDILSVFVTKYKPIPNLIKPYFDVKPYTATDILDVNNLAASADMIYIRYDLPDESNRVKLLDVQHEHLPSLLENEYFLRVDGDSLLEKALFSDSINLSMVREIYEGVKDWTQEERFFYIPMLTFLVRKAVFEITR